MLRGLIIKASWVAPSSRWRPRCSLARAVHARAAARRIPRDLHTRRVQAAGQRNGDELLRSGSDSYTGFRFRALGAWHGNSAFVT
jgi:hypothetical protein